MQVINKTDLAQAVGADLTVMERDALRMRDGGPFVFAQVGWSTLLLLLVTIYIIRAYLSSNWGNRTSILICCDRIEFVQYELLLRNEEQNKRETNKLESKWIVVHIDYDCDIWDCASCPSRMLLASFVALSSTVSHSVNYIQLCAPLHWKPQIYTPEWNYYQGQSHENRGL